MITCADSVRRKSIINVTGQQSELRNPQLVVCSRQTIKVGNIFESFSTLKSCLMVDFLSVHMQQASAKLCC